MKRPIVYLVLAFCVTTFTFAQKEKSAVIGSLTKRMGNSTVVGNFVIRGVDINWEDSTVRCHKECELSDDNTVLQADDLHYNTKTGVAAARGNVSMKYIGAFAALVPEKH